MIAPRNITILIILAALMFSSVVIARSSTIREAISRRDMLVVGLMMLLCAAFRIVQLSNPSIFYGNEYEDSYEYIASALLLRKLGSSWSVFYNPTCLVGSIDACSMSGITSHPIGFASLVAMLPIFKSTERTAMAISAAANVLTLAPLYIASLVTTGSRATALLAGLAYLLFPIGNLYAVTPTPEAVSVLFGSLLILVWIAVFWVGKSRSLADLGAVTLATVALVLLRRDHLVLFATLPVATWFGRWPGDARWSVHEGVRWVGMLAPAGLLLWLFLDPKAAGMEAVSSYRDRFGVGYFFDLLPTFCGSLLRFEWYAGLPLVAIFSIANWRNSKAERFWSVIFVGYVVLFSAFDHGYYYPRTGEVSTAHVGRYMTQALVPLAVLVAAGGVTAYRAATPRLRYVALASVCAIAAWDVFVWLDQLRSSQIAAEQEYRIEPTRRVLESLPQGLPIMAIEPVLLQVVGGDEVFTINLASLGRYFDVDDVNRIGAVHGGFAYYQRGECQGLDRERYSIACLEIEKMLLGNRNNVQEISVPVGKLFRVSL